MMSVRLSALAHPSFANAGPPNSFRAEAVGLAGGVAASGLFDHPQPVIAQPSPPCSGDVRPVFPDRHIQEAVMAQHSVTFTASRPAWLYEFDFTRLTAAQRLRIEHLAARNEFAAVHTVATRGGRDTRIVPSPALVALVPALAPYAPTAPDEVAT